MMAKNWLNSVRIIGIIMIIVGVFSSGMASFLGADINYVAVPEVTPLFPSGTTTSPCSLVGNQQIQFMCYVATYAGQEPTSVTVKVYASGNLITTTPIVLSRSNPALAITDGGEGSTTNKTGYTYRSATKWLLPYPPGTYSFVFEATNVAGKGTATAIGTVPNAPPVIDKSVQGTFKINGQAVYGSTTITVTDPHLDLGFTATKGGEYVTSVYTKLYPYGSSSPMQTTTLVKAGSEWNGDLTLPSVGKYTLTCEAVSDKLYTISTLVADLGEAPTPGGGSIAWIYYIVIAVGVFLVWRGKLN